MSNLRDRLRRIQEQKTSEPIQITVNKEQKTDNKEQRTNNIEKLYNKGRKIRKDENDTSDLIKHGWEVCGYKVLKRAVIVKSPFDIFKTLPSALPVLIPDLQGRDIPSLEDFIFFDLETTGL